MTRLSFRMRAAIGAAALATGAALIGCSASPQTGIVVEITSDLSVPGALDQVQVSVTTSGGSPLYQQVFSLAGANAGGAHTLPLRLGLEPQGDATVPFRIEAVGRHAATDVVSRSATVRFVSGRVLLLTLPLLATCQGVTCAQAGTTCGAAGACVSDTVDPASLPTYHPGSAGAGGSAGGGGSGGGGSGGGGGTAGGGGGTGGAGATVGTGGSAGNAGAGGIGGRGGSGGTGGSSASGGTGGRGGSGGTGGSGASGGTGGGGASGGSGGSAGGRGGTGGSSGGRGGGGGSAGTGTGGGDGGVVVTTLNNGLVGYWAFDQSSTAYPDYSGNGNTATALAGTWTAAGEVGGALDLTNAVYFAVGTPGSASVNTITGAVSVAAWIVPLPAGAVYTIMSRVINAGYWKVGLNITGALSFSAGTRVVATPGMPGDGTKWVHVAASYDGTTARLYVNGAQVAVATFGAISLIGGPADGGPGGYGPDIGGTYDNTMAYDVDIYNGQMDEVVVYNRALTATEVDALARGALPMRK